jgi:hypothetical protein
MPILDYLRTKFGLGESGPDSALLVKALGDTEERIAKNRAEARELSKDLPGAVIRSIDAGATERRKLAALESEHGALVATAAAIRSELAEAQARESEEALAKAWAEAERKGNALKAAGEELTTAIAAMVEKARAVLRADEDFRPAVPETTAEWKQLNFAGGLAHKIALELFIKSDGALRPRDGVWQSPYALSRDPRATVAGSIEEHVAIAFKGRRQTATEASTNEIAAQPGPQTSDSGSADESTVG